MDNQGWIKLYRKLEDHPIMQDATALQIFIWILMKVNYKTGELQTGRFIAAEVLKMKPRTFHKALLERVQNKYKLVTLSSDNKKTTILVNKWKLYQQDSDTSSDTSVTTKGQQSDTIQELRSKNNTYNQQADPNLIKSVLGVEIQKPKSFTRWQEMAVDYAGKLGFTPTPSWFKFFKNGSEGRLQNTYSKISGLHPTDPEKYFYKIYGGQNVGNKPNE